MNKESFIRHLPTVFAFAVFAIAIQLLPFHYEVMEEAVNVRVYVLIVSTLLFGFLILTADKKSKASEHSSPPDERIANFRKANIISSLSVITVSIGLLVIMLFPETKIIVTISIMLGWAWLYATGKMLADIIRYVWVRN